MVLLLRAFAIGYILIAVGLVAAQDNSTTNASGNAVTDNPTTTTVSSDTTSADSDKSTINSSITPTTTTNATNNAVTDNPTTTTVSSDTTSAVSDNSTITPTTTVSSQPETVTPNATEETTSIQPTSVWADTTTVGPPEPVNSSVDNLSIEPSATVTDASQSIGPDTNETEQGSPDTQPASGRDSHEGELTTGGKVAIGIFVSLAVVALIVGGVCFYHRTNDPKGTLKNLVNPGIQYKSFDTTGGKDEESTVTMR